MQMRATLKDVIARAVKAYPTTEFRKWVLDWPGQAVLTAQAICWTAEASEAIVSNTLDQFLFKCNNHLSDIVALVEDVKLSTMHRKTLHSLIVTSVHAR